MQLEGTVLRGRAFEPVEGRVVVEDGTITAVEETTTDSTDIILPAFVNAHTHLGDSIAKEAGGGLSLDELVAPPDGLKHRLLRAASTDEKAAAMARSLRMMEHGGTAACLEFREGGVEGVDVIRQALDGRDIEAVVLGRETADAMREADGFGASGARDAEFGELRAETADARKLFGIHAGERDSHDITPALDLDPDFLVHMVYPEPEHLQRVEDDEIPIAVCPRSNLVTGVGVPPIRDLVERTTVALGTDNVMLNSPSMFREMEFTSKLADVPAVEILRMATINGADIADLNYGLVEEGRDAKLLVLDGDSDNLAGVQDVVRAVVRRAGMADVKDVYL
ncbi:nucleoside deaminase (cytosine deaminase, guanine deaminase) amidohydrolase,chlorohydrolase family protein [Haloferax elongans ATCC BAA-1513]|uniref:Nucleoside deaminase (Cytosine deaminase, guanine deaminase) amidohydrolase,chlorohydrolase family protein n=1 Tax=Haloferax elongans ATCC BAA-1513 TaxID=1230453 RepID=M0HFG2_HALEO|nr:amidohydrolase family protein [Haloferax elongans]ELZ82472.1 nucleoside deaminase (cytosine deaminase, guanine deaminase) amidohydrolase,chlorohydrolase family protein [Haloferax elongans ATCC BAA-1513]